MTAKAAGHMSPSSSAAFSSNPTEPYRAPHFDAACGDHAIGAVENLDCGEAHLEFLRLLGRSLHARHRRELDRAAARGFRGLVPCRPGERPGGRRCRLYRNASVVTRLLQEQLVVLVPSPLLVER
jgi:hypothetical protein